VGPVQAVPWCDPGPVVIDARGGVVSDPTSLLLSEPRSLRMGYNPFWLIPGLRRAFGRRPQRPGRLPSTPLAVEELERRLVPTGPGAGTGLVGNYFSDPSLTNLALTRTDATVNFSWSNAPPGNGVPATGFSARWTGKVQAQFSEPYTFFTDSAGGV